MHWCFIYSKGWQILSWKKITMRFISNTYMFIYLKYNSSYFKYKFAYFEYKFTYFEYKFIHFKYKLIHFKYKSNYFKYKSTYFKYKSTYFKYKFNYFKYKFNCFKYKSTYFKYKSTYFKYKSTYFKYKSTYFKYKSNYFKYKSNYFKYKSNYFKYKSNYFKYKSNCLKLKVKRCSAIDKEIKKLSSSENDFEVFQWCLSEARFLPYTNYVVSLHIFSFLFIQNELFWNKILNIFLFFRAKWNTELSILKLNIGAWGDSELIDSPRLAQAILHRGLIPHLDLSHITQNVTYFVFLTHERFVVKCFILREKSLVTE